MDMENRLLPSSPQQPFTYLKVISMLLIHFRLRNPSSFQSFHLGCEGYRQFWLITSSLSPVATCSFDHHAEKPKSYFSRSPLVLKGLKDCFAGLLFTHPKMVFVAFAMLSPILKSTGSHICTVDGSSLKYNIVFFSSLTL